MTEAEAIEQFVRTVADLTRSGIPWREPEHGVNALFGELHKAFDQGTKRQFKDPNFVRRCAYQDCSISGKDSEGQHLVSANSHVIAKGASLRPLATPKPKEEVLQPDIKDIDSPKMSAVPIKRASTFVGYCRTHEEVFSKCFEEKLELKTTKDFLLQLMRSTARELWAKKIFIENLMHTRDVYHASIDRLQISQAVKDEWHDRLQSPLLGLSLHARGQYARLSGLHADLFNNLDADALPKWVLKKEFRSTLEVALSGSTSLNDYRLPTGPLLPGYAEAPMMVMAVLPNKGSTLILLAAAAEFEGWVSAYGSNYLKSPDELTHAWMKTTDHWFARESWWYTQDEKWRKEVLEALVKP